MSLPNLIVIGAMKCATTSLYNYLRCHPSVFMPHQKELDFFVEDLNWNKGLEWYASHFESSAPVRGEASPNYTNFPVYTGVAERIRNTLPGVKLIYAVRDPIQRAISHYQHECMAGRESRPIAEALADLERNPYVDRSRYHYQLEQYLRHFSLQQILVIDTEDLLHQRTRTVQTIYRFIGVSDTFESGDFHMRINQTVEKIPLNSVGSLIKKVVESDKVKWRLPARVRAFLPSLWSSFARRAPEWQLDPSVRRKLKDFFRDDARKLRELTGQSFRSWSV